MPITITAGAQVSQYLEMPKVAAAVGQLMVRTEPAGARVSVDGVGRGTSPVTVSELRPGEHAVQLESDSAGRHEIEIINEALGYRAVRTIQVAPGKVTPVRVEFPKGAIALNALPWAEVWVDGEKVGETPIGNLQLTIGTHDILFRHPDLGEQRHKATISLLAPTRLSVDMRKK
jgi:hypothetical protein